MSVDKLVDSTQLDSDLTDVADEIRTAGGTLLPLSFPDDYVVAIGDIGNTEIKTASGSIAHFEDALARKAQDLTVAIEPVQSGSGDPSPDNVRPISGWTGANIHVSPTTDAADGTTYSIEFPTEAGTVYGGTLDVTTGKLTVTHASDALTGQETIVESTYKNGFFMIGSNQNYDLINKYAIPKAAPYPVPVCSHYKGIPYEPAVTAPYGTCDTFMGNNGKTIGFKTTFDEVSEFQSYLAAQNTNGTPVRFVLPLMTPQTYDLTPVEVTTLLGTNNVWADTGDSTIQYIAPKAQIPSAQGVYF